MSYNVKGDITMLYLLILVTKIICVFIMSYGIVGMINCLATERQIHSNEAMSVAVSTTVFVTLQWLM